jgi:Peptidase family M23/PEP-CTERM motif
MGAETLLEATKRSIERCRCTLRIVLALSLGGAAIDAAAQFVLPIGGQPFKDWTIVNYVDTAPGLGVSDYLGGTYTYDGHNGIDFTLPNFAAMDRGIPVFAAAAGTVVSVVDGEFDRCSSAAPCASGANYIVIDHGDGITTEYWHLANGSIDVSVGQAVSAGETIAKVGSSGWSSDAHLHFVVTDNGLPVDTYQNPTRWWIDPLPYAGTQRGVLDFGITYRNPSLLELQNRPPDPGSFIAGADDTVYMWVNFFGTKVGDLLNFAWYAPDGDRFAGLSWAAPEMHYGWWVAAVNLPDDADPGTWRVAFDASGEVLASSQFAVAAVPEPETYALMLFGLAALALHRRRRARSG